MNIFLKLTLVIIIIAYITAIIISMKKNKLNSYISIFWLISGFILLFMICVPNLIELMSHLLGFATAANMLFCFTIFIAFYILFILTIRISENYQRSIKLTQKIGLLEKKIHDLEEKINEKNKS